jgi:hypothetical protein
MTDIGLKQDYLVLFIVLFNVCNNTESIKARSCLQFLAVLHFLFNRCLFNNTMRGVI